MDEKKTAVIIGQEIKKYQDEYDKQRTAQNWNEAAVYLSLIRELEKLKAPPEKNHDIRPKTR